MGAASIRGKSMTTDEDSHLSYGQQVLERGSFARRIQRHNATTPFMALNVLGQRLAEAAGLPARGADGLFYSRLPTLLLGAALGWLVFCWARELYGPRAGLLALSCCAFSPNLLAHSALATTDVVATLAIFAALYATWRCFAAPSRGRLLLAGLALGCALAAKLTAVFLGPILLLLWGGRELARRRGEALPLAGGRGLAALAAIGMLGVLSLNALFGFEGSLAPLAGQPWRSERFSGLAERPLVSELPLPLPRGFVDGLDWNAIRLARGRWTYCLGRYSQWGFPHYYLVALLTKGTLGMLALAALGGAVAVAWRRAAPAAAPPAWRRALLAPELFLVVPLLFYLGYFSLLFQYQIGLRHLLPIFPLAFVLVGRLASLAAPIAPAAWLLAALHAASSLSLHPHYLAYFNEAAGGPLQGWRFLADSNLDWGQDRAAARAYRLASPVPVLVHPPRPTAGRIMVRANELVGLKPGGRHRYRWLREGFTPVDHVGYSYLIYEVSPAALRRCCPEAASDAGPNPRRSARRPAPPGGR